MSEEPAFRGKYWFLSNFYPCTVELGGISYPSSEHAFVAAKIFDNSEDQAERVKISKIPTASAVKKYGRTVILRPNWEKVKLEVMENILRVKFSDPFLKQKLAETKGTYLEEKNPWHDTYWGTCNGIGQNHLGKLLMKIRDE